MFPLQSVRAVLCSTLRRVMTVHSVAFKSMRPIRWRCSGKMNVLFAWLPFIWLSFLCLLSFSSSVFKSSLLVQPLIVWPVSHYCFSLFVTFSLLLVLCFTSLIPVSSTNTTAALLSFWLHPSVNSFSCVYATLTSPLSLHLLLTLFLSPYSQVGQHSGGDHFQARAWTQRKWVCQMASSICLLSLQSVLNYETIHGRWEKWVNYSILSAHSNLSHNTQRIYHNANMSFFSMRTSTNALTSPWILWSLTKWEDAKPHMVQVFSLRYMKCLFSI